MTLHVRVARDFMLASANQSFSGCQQCSTSGRFSPRDVLRPCRIRRQSPFHDAAPWKRHDLPLRSDTGRGTASIRHSSKYVLLYWYRCLNRWKSEWVQNGVRISRSEGERLSKMASNMCTFNLSTRAPRSRHSTGNFK